MKDRVRWLGPLTLLCLASIGTFSARQSLAQDTPSGPEQLAFFIGKWEVDVRTLNPDGTVTMGKATTEAYYILDGHAIQDDWRSLDAAGNVVFRGTSIRTHIPATGKWVVHWAMANVPGYTYIDAEWREGELLGAGTGVDGGGPFLERYRYYDITNNHYAFSFERSYDDGESWRKMVELDAKKVE